MDAKKLKRRAALVRAMDKVAHSVNDEELFVGLWLTLGVADEDIKEDTTDEDLESYCEDETFKGLMYTFLNLMKEASKDGGLYCDGVTSL